MSRTSPAAAHRPVSPGHSDGLPRRHDWPVVGPALSSALLLWLAFPPFGWWQLAWLAPLCWLRLVSRPDLPGRRPYVKLYAVGIVHWLLMIQWIRLPHWSAWLGWWALSIYLGLYLPLFIGTTRLLVHRWGWSIVWAAPVAWTGLELARGHLLTGFSMSLLGHSQLPWLALVQIADLTGAYGVSFLVMWVAASLERVATLPGRPVARLWPLCMAAAAILVCWAYGTSRLRFEPPSPPLRELRVALIQGVFDTQFDGDTQRPIAAFHDYVRLSQRAVAQTPELNLVVWPESMFTANTPMVTFEEPLPHIPEWTGSPEQLQQRLESLAEGVRAKARWTAEQVGVPLLVGTAWDHLCQGQTLRYNSAVLIDRQGHMAARYDKMHPVMFGEYVPFGQRFPWLYQLTPMPGGLTPGTTPQALEVEGVRVCPSICFENTVPHLVRRQVRALRARATPPMSS